MIVHNCVAQNSSDNLSSRQSSQMSNGRKGVITGW